MINTDRPSCGVLVDLKNIQALFNPDPENFSLPDELWTYDSHLEPHDVHIDAYPLGFLRTAGNIQADGIPHCFYPHLTNINQSVRLPPNNCDVDVDEEDEGPSGGLQVVKPICSQFYNYITHRVAARAGSHDSQKGTVSAAIAGAFAKTEKDKRTALKKQSHCAIGLPHERFHTRISIENCPTCCRAEFVYSIDVRALKERSGRYLVRDPLDLIFRSTFDPEPRSLSYIYKNIIVPLARSWTERSVLRSIKDHLVVLKPEVRVTL
jgi:hypothetical protein